MIPHRDGLHSLTNEAILECKRREGGQDRAPFFLGNVL